MAAESVSGDTPLVTELLTVGGPVVEVLVWNDEAVRRVAVGRNWRSSAKE